MNSSCRKHYKKGKILLVSRDKLFNEILFSWMTREGFDFKLVKTFEEVIPAISRERFDVVVPTNMCLPPDEIPDLVTRLRQESPEVGIFVISGLDGPKLKKRSCSEGANSIKPLSRYRNFLVG